jgi:hypothetical protein
MIGPAGFAVAQRIRRHMIRSLPSSARTRPGSKLLALAALLLAFNLAACSSDPPPDMNTVKKLVAEDRQFEALQILIPLATAGDPQAQYELAGFYHYGYVGANDYSKALKWYRASARQGYADAMVGLSVMYLGGQGVAKDRREAFVWLNLAAQYMADKQALSKVKRMRDEIGKTLTKDDIAYAKAESLLLQPDSSSVQPNEAESIDHLPEPATVGAEPLQNVPPDTGPVTTLPMTTAPVTTAPITTAPVTTAPVTTAPVTTMPMPITTTPATTTPASSAPALPEMELQPSLPAAPRPVTTLPATTTPTTTAVPSPKLPSTTLPATTPSAAPPQVPPSSLPPVLPPPDPVDPVPEF